MSLSGSKLLQLSHKCPWCGEELEPAAEMTACGFCNISELSDWLCPNGHYACPGCRSASAKQAITRICDGASETDPFVLANRVLRHPAFTPGVSGYHLVIAPIVLTCLRNAGLISLEDIWLPAAMNRLDDVPAGACGFRGECGAISGVGATVSVLLGANLDTVHERTLSLRATSEALADLAALDQGRCCMLSVFSGLLSGTRFLAERLNLNIPYSRPVCDLMRTQDCNGPDCPFHPRAAARKPKNC